MQDDAAITITSLTKRYTGAKTNAVDNVTLSIRAGEVYGFLGSNGAGKSTTIRTIMNFIRATSGTVMILGKDSATDAVAVHRDIGYVSGDVALPKNVTGKQLLSYLGDLHGSVDKPYLRLLVDRFSVQLDQKIGELSKGNRQKVGLLQALMHKPKILILDEPTSGLDPLMQEAFYETILEAKARGAAILFSSHNFAEVERICDRVAIIRNGKLVVDASVQELQKSHMPSWRVTVKDKTSAKQLLSAPGLTVTSQKNAMLTVRPTRSIRTALAALSKVEIVSIVQQTDELENEFMSFYKQGTK